MSTIDRLQSVATRVSTTTTSTAGADVALRSAQLLTKDQGEGFGDVLRRGVAAALIGVTLLGGAQTARADTLNVPTPQTAGALYTHQATGPPGLVTDCVAKAGDSLTGAAKFTSFLGASSVTSATTTNPAVDARTKAAFDQFEARLTQILHRDAASLASGHSPVNVGDALTGAQQSQVQSALTNLVSELPVGAFGPGVQQTLEATFAKVGHDVDLSTTRLKDLGSEGGKAAKQLVETFKREHPAAFWSMASVAAAGAVAVGYTQGTDALAKLGIKPEVKTTLFKSVDLSVGIATGAKLSDPRATLGLSSQHTFGDGTTVRGGVEARLRGTGFSSGTISAGVSTTSGFNADAAVNLASDFKPVDVRLSASQQFDRWHVGGDASYNFTNDRFTSSVSAGRTFDINTKNDLGLQIRGSIDSQGESRIGLGATFRW